MALAVLSRIAAVAGWEAGPLSADSLLATPLIIGARLLDSTHEAWSELGIQSAASQVCIFEHIEKESIATLASGSPIHKYSKERMHDM